MMFKFLRKIFKRHKYGDIVPCRICGSVELGHDQCGEGMQMEWAPSSHG